MGCLRQSLHEILQDFDDRPQGAAYRLALFQDKNDDPGGWTLVHARPKLVLWLWVLCSNGWAAPPVSAPPTVPTTPLWPANTVVIPGHGARSRMVTTLTGQTRPSMPYTGGPFTAAQVKMVRDWIDGGATAAGYEKGTRALFVARCLPCHSAESHGWNLVVDSYTGLRDSIWRYHQKPVREPARVVRFR
jgi:hypothetical protein